MQKVELSRELLEQYKFGLFATESGHSSYIRQGDVSRVTFYGISGWTRYAVLGFSVTRYCRHPFSGATIEVERWEEHVEFWQPALLDDDGMLVIHLPWKNITLLPPTHTTQSLEARFTLDPPIGINH